MSVLEISKKHICSSGNLCVMYVLNTFNFPMHWYSLTKVALEIFVNVAITLLPDNFDPYFD